MDIFIIDSNGKVFVAQDVLEFAKKNKYEIQVQVEYGSGQIAVTLVNITISHINKPPQWSVGQVGVTKDASGGYIVGDLNQFASDPDGDDLEFFILDGAALDGITFFNVESSGKLVVAEEADLLFEDLATHFFMVILVVDNGSPPLNTTGKLIVIVSGLSKPNFIDSGKVLEIEENSQIGTQVGGKLRAYNTVSFIYFPCYIIFSLSSPHYLVLVLVLLVDHRFMLIY